VAGDNIVFQVEAVEHYLAFARPYCKQAVADGRKLVYFRFAKHEPVLEDTRNVEVCELDPGASFEAFLDKIHVRIEKAGRGAFYVFDCLSDLSADWYSDQMIGNFFMLTCPYLYDLETVAYFGLLRNYHSAYATGPISNTTQILIDVHRHKDQYYIHPLKVQNRSSSTMYMMHAWKDNTFEPVLDSSTNAEILTSGRGFALDSARHRLGTWTRTLLHAEEVLEALQRGEAVQEQADELFHRMLRMAISRDDRVLKLVEKHLTLKDVVEISHRMIGTGLVGGKSVGMLLARAILRKKDPRWSTLLEVHDSFYIASDVFYTFLVRNGCWWIRQKLRQKDNFLADAERGRHHILTGTFPAHIEQQFGSILDYYGQSPIIVRSSSLLEDNFGNSFVGKYDSVFLANQGARQQRLDDFVSAVKRIYASSMSEAALSYRARHGLLDRDEQMALLVQRVSGGLHEHLFYPQIAGVGLSFNPYVWGEYIDPSAGMLRLVLGLGTRAVDRADDDYTRIVALNAPERRPEAERDDASQFAQRKVDVLDLNGNQLVTTEFEHVVEHGQRMPVDLFATPDHRYARMARGQGRIVKAPLVLNFDKLIKETQFINDMREMLATLQEAYEYPVDVEFTANFQDADTYHINLVQCRPLQVKGVSADIAPLENVPRKDMILATSGPLVGQSRIEGVERIIYVVPAIYGNLPLGDRYSVARLIGKLNQRLPEENAATMLIGPGRWGTTTPSLGVPVSFAEINRMSILCEIVAMRDDLTPDVSLGTHFFSELVEMDMLYLVLFPDHAETVWDRKFFEEATNHLTEVVPDAEDLAHVVKLIRAEDILDADTLLVHADTMKQRALFYRHYPGQG
jgi:hypothetical protein